MNWKNNETQEQCQTYLSSQENTKDFLRVNELRKTQSTAENCVDQYGQRIYSYVMISENGELKYIDKPHNDCVDNGDNFNDSYCNNIISRRHALVEALQQSNTDTDAMDAEAINKQLCITISIPNNGKGTQMCRKLAEMLRCGVFIEKDSDEFEKTIEADNTT